VPVGGVTRAWSWARRWRWLALSGVEHGGELSGASSSVAGRARQGRGCTVGAAVGACSPRALRSSWLGGKGAAEAGLGASWLRAVGAHAEAGGGGAGEVELGPSKAGRARAVLLGEVVDAGGRDRK
jgi:hypothetical protein